MAIPEAIEMALSDLEQDTADLTPEELRAVADEMEQVVMSLRSEADLKERLAKDE